MIHRSRSHLYRSSGAQRPIATVLILAIWLGGSALYLAARGPALFSSAGPVSGGSVDAQLLALVLVAGVLASVLVIVAELMGGRSTQRDVRAALAVAVLVCSAAGTSSVWPESPAGRGLVTPADAATTTPSRATMSAQNQLAAVWLALGSVAAAAALTLSFTALRSWSRRA